MIDVGNIVWRYINLASRTDRDVQAREEFAKAGLIAERFDALKPEDWPGEAAQVAQMRATTAGGTAGGTPGAIGCYLSQTEVIRTVVDTDRIVGVCEDDVCFCEDFQKRLAYVAEHLTWDWDIFYFGATFHAPGKWYTNPDCAEWAHLGRDAEPTPAKHIMRVYGEWGTYAYLVNGCNARKVLDLFDANVHRSRGIDHLAIILGPRLNAYCFVPGCCWQRDGWSNVRVGGFTQFSNFKRLGPYAWTERIEDFDPGRFD